MGRRLRARPAGDAPGPLREDASFGLDRLPQPLHRRGPLLRPREPGHPRGFAVAGLGKSRRQPRTVRGQRQDLPRQGPAIGLHPTQHPALAPAAARSSGRRPDRTLLPDLPDAIGSGSPRRNDPYARRLEPRLGGLAARWPITRTCTARPGKLPTSATSRSPGSCGRSIWGPCWASSIRRCCASSTRTSRTCVWRACSSPSIRRCGAIGWSSSTIPSRPLAEVQLYTPDGRLCGPRPALPAGKGQPSPTVAPPPAGPIAPHYLDALRAEHAAMQEQRRNLGIDYHSARQRNVWSLSSFARVFARFLGRPGRRVRADRPGNGPPGRLPRPPRSRHREPAPAGLRAGPGGHPSRSLVSTPIPDSRKERLMYLEHLQLKSQPFAEHATVAALWQDQRMDEGLARLEYLVQSGQLGLITGPSGVGKSALLKRFLHGLLPQHCQALYCHLSHLPPHGPAEAGRHATGRDAAPRQRTHLRADPGTGLAGRGHLVVGLRRGPPAGRRRPDRPAAADQFGAGRAAAAEAAPGRSGTAPRRPAAGAARRPLESHLGPLPVAATDPRADLPLHRLPARPGRRRLRNSSTTR